MDTTINIEQVKEIKKDTKDIKDIKDVKETIIDWTKLKWSLQNL